MDVTGKILYINNVETPSEAKPDFKTRSFGLDMTKEDNGTVFENFAAFQTVNQKNDLLNNLNIGDEIKVHFGIKGTKKIKSDAVNSSPKNTTNIVVYTNLNCWNIELLKKADGSQPTTQTTQSQPTQIPQPTGDIPLDIDNGKPMIWNSTKGEWEKDELPF